MKDDIEEKAEELQKKLLPPKEETYKVFEYFLNNIPLLLTVGSVVVAVSVAFINLLSYLTQHRYLEYWNIYTSILQINGKSETFYTIVISITYSIAVSLIGLLLPNFLNNMYVHDITRLYNKLGVKCAKRNLKIMSKNQKYAKKQLKKYNNALDQIKKANDTDACKMDSSEIIKLENELSDLVQTIKSYDSEIVKILDSIKKFQCDIRRERILRLAMFRIFCKCLPPW